MKHKKCFSCQEWDWILFVANSYRWSFVRFPSSSAASKEHVWQFIMILLPIVKSEMKHVIIATFCQVWDVTILVMYSYGWSSVLVSVTVCVMSSSASSKTFDHDLSNFSHLDSSLAFGRNTRDLPSLWALPKWGGGGRKRKREKVHQLPGFETFVRNFTILSDTLCTLHVEPLHRD